MKIKFHFLALPILLLFLSKNNLGQILDLNTAILSTIDEKIVLEH